MENRPILHPWRKSATQPDVYARSLAAPELVLSLVNDYALGHNCPYLGVTISVLGHNGAVSSITVEELEARVNAAFVHARWVYPLVASRVEDNRSLTYRVETAENVSSWASRTVETIHDQGGWPGLHSNLSREDTLPSKDGDCVFLYLVLKPGQDHQSPVTQFDLLLHAHHGLTDGAGLRSIMNQVLIGLTKTKMDLVWGEEVERLSPAAVDVALLSKNTLTTLLEMSKEIPLPPLRKLEGLTSRPGTGFVAHTFESTEFLDRLLTLATTKQVKLTAVIQSALMLALYSEIKTPAEDHCTVISGFDLRTRQLVEPWNSRNKFLGAGVGLEMMKIPVSLLGKPRFDGSLEESHFWSVAQHIQKAWVAVSQRPDVAAAGELRKSATGFIIQHVLSDMNSRSNDLSLNLNYVSDPGGSQQLDGLYKTDGNSGINFSLEKYQLVTDESTPKLSCRSHSWNGLLTLSISFNHGRHTKNRIQNILKRWCHILVELMTEESRYDDSVLLGQETQFESLELARQQYSVESSQVVHV